MKLELVDVEDDPREVAEEEGHGDAGEDDHQGPLVTVVHPQAAYGDGEK